MVGLSITIGLSAALIFIALMIIAAEINQIHDK